MNAGSVTADADADAAIAAGSTTQLTLPLQRAPMPSSPGQTFVIDIKADADTGRAARFAKMAASLRRGPKWTRHSAQ